MLCGLSPFREPSLTSAASAASPASHSNPFASVTVDRRAGRGRMNVSSIRSADKRIDTASTGENAIAAQCFSASFPLTPVSEAG